MRPPSLTAIRKRRAVYHETYQIWRIDDIDYLLDTIARLTPAGVDVDELCAEAEGDALPEGCDYLITE
jgi:hypothetical protein